ncbi:unnamed protein product [Brassica rapa subsp. narinosa]
MKRSMILEYEMPFFAQYARLISRALMFSSAILRVDNTKKEFG